MGWTHAITTAGAWAVLLAMAALVVRPTFHDLKLLAGHDWDEMEGYRYLVVKTIGRFHQFPFWNPYTCGGHPVWGGVESDTIVISPFFPAYMLLPLPVAMRVELVGSALLSMSGTWLFAGRFTRSPSLKAFVVAVCSINGRWALQAAAGHSWHFAYEWTPWTLYFLDRAFAQVRAVPPERLPPMGDIVGAGVSMAMMVYMGGIYPLPHTIVLVGLYVAFFAIRARDGRPVVCALAAGLVAFAFSAPKLLPTLEVFSRFPRFTDSTEWMDGGLLWAILTSPDQDFGSRPAPTPQWGWHEWGMYVGAFPVVAIAVALVFARSPRLTAWKWTSFCLVALALGAVHRYAPWTLLHRVSLFRSHHVPSRWLYPALLLAACVAAAVVERGLARVGRWRPTFELALLAVASFTAYDVGSVARLPLLHAFERPPPRAVESTGEFHTEVHMPPEIAYPTGGDWAPNTLPLVIANVGMTDCGSFFQFHNYYRDHNNHAPGLGAKGRGDPGYRGEAFVVEGEGRAAVSRWSPNEIEITVSGARAGEHVAIDQNYDPGWTADGRAVDNMADVAAVVLRSSDEVVVFRYRPPWLWTGLALFVSSVAGLAWYAVKARRLRAVENS
jgi:hypothetical protein